MRGWRGMQGSQTCHSISPLLLPSNLLQSLLHLVLLYFLFHKWISWISLHFSQSYVFFTVLFLLFLQSVLNFISLSNPMVIYGPLLKPLAVPLSLCVTHPQQLRSNLHHYRWSLWHIVQSTCVPPCTQTHTLPINLYNWKHSNRFQLSDLAESFAHSLAFSNIKLELVMSPTHIKVHWSAVTLPFDHLRIVQIDLHKVLLLSMVAIERPVKQEKDHIEYNGILYLNRILKG